MNRRDTSLWKSGRAKVDAGLPLTDDEHEVLEYFGGDEALRPKPRVVSVRRQARATKQRQDIHTANMAGKLTFS